MGAVPYVLGFPVQTEIEQQSGVLDLLVEDALSVADGLLLQGGTDVDANHYGEEVINCVGVVRNRDLLEKRLVETALKRNIPILGICRGMQLINVALGGTLYQHLEPPKFLRHFPDFHYEDGQEIKIPARHPLCFTDSGILRQVYGCSEIDFPSQHHQGIKNLADRLTVEARSPDGLIEAYSDHKRKILAVQWHPELSSEGGDRVAPPISYWLNSWVLPAMQQG
jgi:putative glutamine amidotransferase